MYASALEGKELKATSKMIADKCKSGVYFIRYDDACIKIGRSKDIESRLKQYSGYRSRGQEVQRLMLVLTPDYIQCE